MTKAWAALIEARRCAVLEVKAELRRQGRVKVQLLARREIAVLANAYLISHPELFEAARERVARWLARP